MVCAAVAHSASQKLPQRTLQNTAVLEQAVNALLVVWGHRLPADQTPVPDWHPLEGNTAEGASYTDILKCLLLFFRGLPLDDEPAPQHVTQVKAQLVAVIAGSLAGRLPCRGPLRENKARLWVQQAILGARVPLVRLIISCQLRCLHPDCQVHWAALCSAT